MKKIRIISIFIVILLLSSCCAADPTEYEKAVENYFKENKEFVSASEFFTYDPTERFLLIDGFNFYTTKETEKTILLEKGNINVYLNRMLYKEKNNPYYGHFYHYVEIIDKEENKKSCPDILEKIEFVKNFRKPYINSRDGFLRDITGKIESYIVFYNPKTDSLADSLYIEKVSDDEIKLVYLLTNPLILLGNRYMAPLFITSEMYNKIKKNDIGKYFYDFDTLYQKVEPNLSDRTRFVGQWDFLINHMERYYKLSNGSYSKKLYSLYTSIYIPNNFFSFPDISNTLNNLGYTVADLRKEIKDYCDLTTGRIIEVTLKITGNDYEIESVEKYNNLIDYSN